MHDRDSRSTRLRYTATGALAALAAVGGVAGTAALAAKPPAKTHGHAAAAMSGITKPPSSSGGPPPSGGPGKAHAPQPGSDQPFLNDVQQLVADGSITAAEGQVLDGEIQGGRVDTDTLTSSGFTPAQLQATQAALTNTKRGLAAAAHSTSK